MPTPSETWADVADADIDADSAIAEDGVLSKLYAQQVYCKEILYGAGTYLGHFPHDHHGHGSNSDAPLAAPISHNLLLASCFDGSSGAWTGFGGGFTELSQGIVWGASLNVGAFQYLPGDLPTSQLGLFGAGGCPLVISFFCRHDPALTPTTGKIRYGIADGSQTVWTSGHSMEVTVSELTTSWQRFYVVLNDTSNWPCKTPVTDLRVLIRMTEAVDNGSRFDITGHSVTMGTSLGPFSDCPVDNTDGGFENWPNGAPIYEKAAVYTSPVKMAAI